MNKQIEKIALEAGFHSDKFGLYWDQDANSEGVDLEQFAELIVKETMQVVAKNVAWNSYLNAAEAVIQHFGIEK